MKWYLPETLYPILAVLLIVAAIVGGIEAAAVAFVVALPFGIFSFVQALRER